MRSRRRGRLTHAPSAASTTAKPTMNVNIRLICSIAECCVDTSTRFESLQFGQSLHPRPELDSRPAAPVTTMTPTSTSAAAQILRNSSEVNPFDRTRLKACRSRTTSPGYVWLRCLPVLSSHDDYPIHQASLPISQPSTSDINFYDRYFFNGYDHDGSSYFAIAMGLYPNRHVVDATFSTIRDGEQVSVFASQRAPSDRRQAIHVGPISVDVVEPMRAIRVSVDAPTDGVRAELTFTARS